MHTAVSDKPHNDIPNTNDTHKEGHYVENQNRHVKHAQDTSLKMYKQGSQAIVAAFEELMKGLPAQLEAVIDPLIAQVKEEFELFLNNHCSGETGIVKEEDPDSTATLQKEALNQFSALEANWLIEVEPPVVVEEKTVEELPISIDDLEQPLDDMDYVQLSDDNEDSVQED